MFFSSRKFGLGCAIAFGAALIAAATAVLWPTTIPKFAEVKGRYTTSDAYLLDRHGEVIDSQRIDFGVRRFEWQPLQGVSPALVDAVVESEDRRFWQHQGVDWPGVMSAIRDQVLLDRRRGASTITMQLASLLESHSRRRSTLEAWRHKLAQVRLAIGIERQWSKQEILEAYFNLLGFRGELQGIGAASYVLTGKSPSGLSLPESLILAALLPNPTSNSDVVTARACARAQARNFPVSCDDIKSAAATLLQGRRNTSSGPTLAPHLAHLLLKTAGERVPTTLDAGIQRLANQVLSQHLATLSERNVRDGAVLVVDNATGDVLAYVGSGGPYSRARNVDGVRAQRQAGSTLKPFLYEMALEQRYLTAASLLEDSPLNLDTVSGVYIPQDYDRNFKGLVSVRTALASSLNVPAVRTLVLVGVQPFRDRLNELGYQGITENGDFYGYSLALGSAEVSLWEQARAYRTLARGGISSNLRVRMNDPVGADQSKLPADASFVVDNILSDRAARVVTFGLDNHLNTSFWSAVKTGTSKDMRDNWCIGFSRQFTVAVWVGNFEGDSMHDVSGVTGAAPVWQELMNALHQNTASTAPAPPQGVISASTRFTPAVEPPRQEWFLNATQSAQIVAVTPEAGIAKISSPANGMIIALDPDIPSGHQRVPISVKGANASMVLKLNDTMLGSAAKPVFWTPRAGAQLLSLEDAEGRTLDRILFTVR